MRFCLSALLLLAAAAAHGQQVPDTSFSPKVSAPAFEAGQGPRVAIDEDAHVAVPAGACAVSSTMSRTASSRDASRGR